MLEFEKIIFKKYKCFKNETTINKMKPINIVIGKNNIGKSSLLDIIEIINDEQLLWNNLDAEIYITKKIIDEEIRRVFVENIRGGDIPGYNHYEFGKKFINKEIMVKLTSENSSYGENKKFVTQSVLRLEDFNPEFEVKYKNYWNKLSSVIKYQSKSVKRIFAERNVNPESDTEIIKVDGYGNGITTMINNYLNKAEYDEDKIRIELLDKLNFIMGNDANFLEITTQQIEYTKDNIEWEIFLREEKKGRIALSKSGSGLKTILMILVFSILLPDIEKKELSEYIFLFEELENNLHPSLERRLLKYIEEISDKGATIFLTTHSNTMLDSFQNNENVQIYHVIKENGEIELKVLDNIVGKKGCLDDLGVKASDILQSNGIIWVEGPSDRIYINKWIELWSNGKYKEGMNYQCVFYGGKLLSNTTFNNENIDDIVNLIHVNKNAVMLIDSDKTSKGKSINDTKKRIKEEFEKNNQFCWITKGKEIENYIPKSIISTFYNKSITDEFGQYQKINEFLDKYGVSEGDKFLRNKRKYAQEYVEKMNIENMKEVLDLNNMINKVLKEIEKWNS